MGIFDVDENIENVSFDRIYKLKRLYDDLSDGASLKGEQIIADTLKISYEFGETEWRGGKRSGYFFNFYKKDDEDNWIALYDIDESDRRIYEQENQTLEEFFVRMIYYIPSDIWAEWNDNQDAGRQIWIDVFELTEEEISELDDPMLPL
jgi:hypothetical protein